MTCPACQRARLFYRVVDDAQVCFQCGYVEPTSRKQNGGVSDELFSLLHDNPKLLKIRKKNPKFRREWKRARMRHHVRWKRAGLTAEERSAYNDRQNELKRERRAAWTPEQRAEENRQQREDYRERRESWTPEEIAEFNRKRREDYRERTESWTPQQRAEHNRKKSEQARRRRERELELTRQ